MSTQNTTAGVLEDTRESRLRDQTDTLVVETADALIREAERASEPLVQPKPTYPEWPTSTPGPQATLPLPGMKFLP